MPRDAKFTDTALVQAARTLVEEGGPSAATVGAIAERVGAPVGSIYHRFRSRDVILGRVLLDVVEEFQGSYARAVGGGSGPGALAAYVIDWTREHPRSASLLMLYRREEYLSEGTPAELIERATRLEQEMRELAMELCHRWLGAAGPREREAVRLAAFEIPRGAVVSRLERGEEIPVSLSALVAAAAEAVIARAKEEK